MSVSLLPLQSKECDNIVYIFPPVITPACDFLTVEYISAEESENKHNYLSKLMGIT